MSEQPTDYIIHVHTPGRRRWKAINCTGAVDPNPILEAEDRGALWYLLSKPDSWQIMVSDLMKKLNVGRDKCYGILRRLKEAGYYHSEKRRNDDGTFVWVRFITDEPMNHDEAMRDFLATSVATEEDQDEIQPSPEKPEVVKNRPLPENPYMVEPSPENPNTVNQEIKNIYRKRENRGSTLIPTELGTDVPAVQHARKTEAADDQLALLDVAAKPRRKSTPQRRTAISILRRITGVNAHQDQRERIEATVHDLDHWEKIINAYCARYPAKHPNMIDPMLTWYKNGIPEQRVEQQDRLPGNVLPSFRLASGDVLQSKRLKDGSLFWPSHPNMTSADRNKLNSEFAYLDKGRYTQ